MKKVLALALAALLVGGVAWAKLVEVDAVVTDNQFRQINSTHIKIEGTVNLTAPARSGNVSQQLAGDPPGSAAIYWGPTAIPTWLNFQIPTDADLDYVVFRFKEITAVNTGGGTAAYTWGDTVKVYVGDTYRAGALQVGMWDSVKVYGICGTDSPFEIYVWTETN